MTHDDFMLGMMGRFCSGRASGCFWGSIQFNAIAEAGAPPGAESIRRHSKRSFGPVHDQRQERRLFHNDAWRRKQQVGSSASRMLRLLNAGLHTCSPHLHANHFYVLAVNNVVMENIVKPDTMTVTSQETEIPASALPSNPLAASQTLLLHGGSRVDWLVPCKRPPDIAADPTLPLEDVISEELSLIIGDVPQSPLAYPMHSHMELDNTAAGGNYPQGMTTHFEFLGELINGEEVHFPNSHAHIDLPGGDNGDHEH